MLLQTIGVEIEKLQKAEQSDNNGTSKKSAAASGIGSIESVNYGDLAPIEEVSESMVTQKRTQEGKITSSQDRQGSKGTLAFG